MHREGTRDREWERGARTPVTGQEGVKARARERGTERDKGWLGGGRTTEKIAMFERDAMHDREGCSERRR